MTPADGATLEPVGGGGIEITVTTELCASSMRRYDPSNGRPTIYETDSIDVNGWDIDSYNRRGMEGTTDRFPP